MVTDLNVQSVIFKNTEVVLFWKVFQNFYYFLMAATVRLIE